MARRGCVQSALAFTGSLKALAGVSSWRGGSWTNFLCSATIVSSAILGFDWSLDYHGIDLCRFVRARLDGVLKPPNSFGQALPELG